MSRLLSPGLALGLVLLVAACAGPQHPPAPATPPAALPIAPPPPQPGGDAKFQAFIRDFEAPALAQGIKPETYDRAVAGIAPIPAIAEMNANQPEFAKLIWLYLDSAVSATRVAHAKAVLAANAAPLAAIAAKSGIPKEILVAIWGMETDFGRDIGRFNLFAALATLAYDGPRQDYARPEFLAALRLLQEQNYPLEEMTASWAGAFGQTQFTPTTFFKYATDGDGDGRIDLWRSSADALASAATLLQRSGWETGKPWGFEVQLPPGFAYESADLDISVPLSDWAARGVTLASGAPLPAGSDLSSIYLPAGARGPAFLTFANFKTILKYNNAASYALAVALLADRMADGAPIKASWPRDEQPLSRDERLRFQQDLKALGFDPGAPDGVLGRKTRAATRLCQKARGEAADGYPTAALLAEMDAALAHPSPNPPQ